jgi:signal transduction histidine kinase
MRLLEISRKMEPPFPVGAILKEDSLLKTLERIVAGDASEKEATVQEITAGKTALRVVSAPLVGPEAKVEGTVTVLEDITDFKQLDQMKSDFVNMVAHELRSPLVAMRQLNSVLLDGLAGPMEEKHRDFVSRGTKKIDTLLDLIKDLLDVAKIEAGKFVQHRIPTDLSHVLRELITLMEPRAKSQGIELTCVLEDLRLIHADPKSMEEIFGNLVSNAINYSPEGGKVRVTGRGLGDYLEIKVEDTGVGIPPEELPKIFDKFYRVKHPKTRKVTGTGLGLAIVKGAIEAHHGTIDVESVPDKGTTFRVLLPVMPQTSP